MSVDQEQPEAPPAAAPHRGADRGVGNLLRQAREQHGQDIESVARALRIRHPYLIAIEEGRFKDLPGAPYASGFVRSYAEFLGLDANEILRRFREESGGMGGRTELVFPAPVSEGGFPAAVLILVVILLAALVYGAWYFYQWRHSSNAEAVSELPDRLTALIHAPGGEDRPASGAAEASPATPLPTTEPAPGQAAVTPTAPAPALSTPPATTPTTTPTTTPPATAATPTATAASPAPAPSFASTPTPPSTPPAAAPAPQVAATPTPPPAPPAAAPAPTPAPAPAAEASKTETVADATPPPAASTAPVQAAPPAPDLGAPSRVVLRATDDCWIEIRDPTGAVVTSRLLRKGDTYPVPPHPGLTLTAGNAGALTLLLDGAVLPPLGKSGMVRHDIALDPDRVGTPAPTATATPTGD